MDTVWTIDFSGMKWEWNWTELCGYKGAMQPLNPKTHDLDICFQQVCLQIPVLGIIALISAYYCGRQHISPTYARDSYKAINLRIVLTVFLALLPILRAYIIVSNATTLPPNHPKNVSTNLNGTLFGNANFLMDRNGIQQNSFASKMNVFSSNQTHTTVDTPPILNEKEPIRLFGVENETHFAKPIDYLVAGIEGMAWFVHLCFLLNLKRGNNYNPRGPLLIRVLIFFLMVVSALLFQSHLNHEGNDDVVPHLSLGFSISTLIILILYTFTLVPGNGTTRQRTRRYNYSEIGERTALLSAPNASQFRFSEEPDSNYLGTAMENSTLLSKILFYWVTPLMDKGVEKSLKHSDDLFDLPDYINVDTVSSEIDKHLEHTPQELLRLLHKCCGWQFYTIGILKFIADCCSFMGPIMLNKLISFITDKNQPVSYGYLYAFILFSTSFIGAIFNTHFTFWMELVGMKIRSIIVTLVYRKVVHASHVELNRDFNFGEITNFMTTDADRIVNSCPSFHTFWSIPLELVVIFYLLHQQIGPSYWVGVVFAIVLIPINRYVANKIGQISQKLMKNKDERVKLIGEMLNGILTIKLNVWEDHFVRRVLKIREREMKQLSSRKYLDALCVYFWATTPVVISILTFTSYVLLGNQLDAKTVFPAMALLNMLIIPLNTFPWVLNGLVEAWISVKRIQRLLNVPEMDLGSYYGVIPPGVEVVMENAMFSVSPNKERLSLTNISDSDATTSSAEIKKNVTFEDESFHLKDINIHVEKGQLVGIVGPVGSGKSLLLSGILSEVTKDDGIVAVEHWERGFGYVKQNPWLQRGTIRDNILFGQTLDFNRYKTALKACALIDDLNALPKKDLTAIADAGNTLSGGQKTRISLARAIYANKDIYLLDDILATLDTKVANHVFQHAILGLLKDKTRIFCMHQTRYLIHTDLVIEMSKGKIVNIGRPTHVLPDLEDYLLSTESIELISNDESILSLHQELDDVDTNERDSLLDDESKKEGVVSLKVYWIYLKSVGYYLSISIFISMILMQCSKNATDLWLSYWLTHTNASAINSTRTSFPHIGNIDSVDKYYLTVYGLIGVTNSFFTLIRAFIFAYGGINAATVIHKQLLKIVIRAKTIFFDVQPVGRIVNRFSADTYTVDDSLPFISNILCAQLFGLSAIIIVIAYGLPWIFLLIAPLVPVYLWLQNHYRLTSREVKRLSSVSLSPLFAHFNETLTGLSIIRAFRHDSRFERDNETFLEANQKTNFASIAAGQWLSLRLQFIGVILLSGVSIMAVIQHQYDIVNPALIGLVITYTLSITTYLSSIVNTFTETEREMVAVERIKQYFEEIPIEYSEGENPPYGWPSQGVIEFNRVVLKYRDFVVPSLKQVSFITRPAEKIGVVGRTGAGKSSLLTSLFRLVEINSGDILIDNVDIKTMQLHALRSRLCIIPQNPFIFSGTVRENVDPLNQYQDLQIYKALEKCMIHTLVNRLGGLGAVLEQGGRNLSVGQRQLLCLVRAVLQNARIVCIDEATANIDNETDKNIQTTIKSSFQTATVITIAHRIRTIMHCDRVLVMGDGEVLEFDEPNFLIQNTDSYFYKLANQEFSDRE